MSDQFLLVNFRRNIREQSTETEKIVCLFVLFGFYVAFNSLYVISRRCLDVAGAQGCLTEILVTPHIPPRHIILTLITKTRIFKYTEHFTTKN